MLLERLHAPRELVAKYRKHVLSLLSLTWPNVLTFFVSLRYISSFLSPPLAQPRLPRAHSFLTRTRSIPFSSSLYVGHLGPEYLAASALGNMIANGANCASAPRYSPTHTAFGFAIGSGLSMALDTLCSQVWFFGLSEGQTAYLCVCV